MFQSRTHNCGELRMDNIGQTVTIAGWMENMREVGQNFAFVIVRDFNPRPAGGALGRQNKHIVQIDLRVAREQTAEKQRPPVVRSDAAVTVHQQHQRICLATFIPARQMKAIRQRAVLPIETQIRKESARPCPCLF